MTVHFIGAGPGAADLITVRGRDLMATCPVCLYAGSLIPRDLLAHCPAGARIVNTAAMSLDDIVAEIEAAHAQGHDVARLHSGDLSVWSAMGEQLRRLRALGIPYTVTPGVPSFAAAAATLGAELTLPGLCQSVVLTRTSGRATSMPEGENLAAFAATGAVLAIHLSIHVAEKVQAELLPHYGADCPAAIVWRASWPDETVVRTTVGALAQAVAASMERTALILVGRSLQAEDFAESRLYAADYDRRYRPLGTEPRFPATDVQSNPALDTARDEPLNDNAPPRMTAAHPLPPIALTLIGIGTGNPDHLTRQAVTAMNAADLILLPHKGEDKAELAALRQSLCDAVLTAPAPQGPVIAGFDMPVRRSEGDDYFAQVDEWHAAITRCWQAGIAQSVAAGLNARTAGAPLRVALLVWGDPALYDSTLRIAARMQPAPVSVEVVAGITSVQALAAAHAIALNEIGQPFVVTTGRQLRDHGWPAGVDTAVVMLDGQCSFTTLPANGLHIWWGAYLGMPQQTLDSGPLAEAGPRIQAARAQARAQLGWIMDIYLLRQTPAHRRDPKPPTACIEAL